MSGKRSRAAYEADLQRQQAPYAHYGTPLPARDPEIRNDGSYVPVWKQEVRDERGLKRLHGAFTGGFSAGYYNTVGSKDGWTPATFTSSRKDKQKARANGEDSNNAQSRPQRAEDFMDEEDLQDAEDARRVQLVEGFAGLGSTQRDASRQKNALDLFRIEGESMGIKLLKKMGWREGQGIGPKVRRAVRHGLADGNDDETHYFAPDDTRIIHFAKKIDQKGLGFQSEAVLSRVRAKSDSEDEPYSKATKPVPKKKPVRGGFGVGILNDTGSDEDDPYSVGPRISYNRVIGADKKKKRTVLREATAPTKPVFISKKVLLAKASLGLRKCHDGRLPLDGFILATTSVEQDNVSYPPPIIPPEWKSSRIPNTVSREAAHMTTAEAAKRSKLTPTARAALLGERALPGKSVFDFLPASARDRIVASTGNVNLPPALGEVPADHVRKTLQQHRESLMSMIPRLEKATAVAALARANRSGGFTPYSDNVAKRAEYLAYLSYSAGVSQEPPSPPDDATITNAKERETWLKELHEFKTCAEIFKPMSGMMATRFTSSTGGASIIKETASTNDDPTTLLRQPVGNIPKPEDPAVEAARLGMFGRMTRTTKQWHPTRLLCKRFNVQPPPHVTAAASGDREDGTRSTDNQHEKLEDLVAPSAVNTMLGEYHDRKGDGLPQHAGASAAVNETGTAVPTEPTPTIDVDTNEALEGRRAAEAVFKAVFGDSSSEDEG